MFGTSGVLSRFHFTHYYRSNVKYFIISILVNENSCFFCSKIGEEQSPEDAEDGPPELLVSTSAVFNTTMYRHRDLTDTGIDTAVPVLILCAAVDRTSFEYKNTV